MTETTETIAPTEHLRREGDRSLTVRGDLIRAESTASFEMFEVSLSSVLSELTSLDENYQDANVSFRVQGWGREDDTLEVTIEGWRPMTDIETREVEALRAAAAAPSSRC